MIDYTLPKCRPSTLDSYTNVRLILSAVERAVPILHGHVLDVGCGRMPYKEYVMERSGRVAQWTGLDLEERKHSEAPPDMTWDGETIDLPDASVDCAMLTEVLEHCPKPDHVVREVFRVLRPGGFIFLTVPFIWPIHTVPYDEFRYTPFSLKRILLQAGFSDLSIEATGGRHAMLAVALGLWVRRRPLTSRVHVVTKAVGSVLLWPVIRLLTAMDERPEELGESTLLVGLAAMARKRIAVCS
ncbi:class I SAM-dependent methyltransferase [Microbaculum marinum]|uniref:Class I SAM-dependent methyltransferase n=1 Tax=Microbaculum marinum TaxID=1764581 RepID=A0AAW9RV60_9HYPH